MKRFTVLLFTLLVSICAYAAPKEPFELVAFDYTELAIETESSVRIQWSGTVESYLTHNGSARVVLALTMDDGQQHDFTTAPFKVQGLGRAEVSDEFVVPRQLWDEAASISVGALDGDAKAGSSNQSNENSQNKAPIDTLEECVRQTIADEDAFPYLRNEITAKKAEIAELETDLMISSGLMRKEQTSKRNVKRLQEQMERLEREQEKLLNELRINIEQYCREL